MKFMKKYKHAWVIPVYGILYLLAFQYVEHRKVRPYIIHMKIDDAIPFCEYFVILTFFGLASLPSQSFTLLLSIRIKKNTGSWSVPWASA